MQNFLMLNTTKTAVIIVGPRELLDQISNGQISLNNTTFASNNLDQNQGQC